MILHFLINVYMFQNIHVLYTTLICTHTIVCMLEKSEEAQSLHFHTYKIPLLIACF